MFELFSFIALMGLLVLALSALGAIGAQQKQQHTEVMSKLKDLASNLGVVLTTLEKVKTEIELLKAATENVDLPADAEAALERLTALSEALDNLNPDAAPPA